MIPPNENADVRIVYSAESTLPSNEEGVNYRAKAVLRRYLSEFRDNYLSRTHICIKARSGLRKHCGCKVYGKGQRAAGNQSPACQQVGGTNQ